MFSVSIMSNKKEISKQDEGRKYYDCLLMCQGHCLYLDMAVQEYLATCISKNNNSTHLREYCQILSTEVMVTAPVLYRTQIFACYLLDWNHWLQSFWILNRHQIFNYSNIVKWLPTWKMQKFSSLGVTKKKVIEFYFL